MKSLFCASILFPYTFWILMHLLPEPPRETSKGIDSKTVGRCHTLMKLHFNVISDSKHIQEY